MKTYYMFVFLILTIACNKSDDPSVVPDDSTVTQNIDCIGENGCTEFIVPNDSYDSNPSFYGYADPSIRKELNSNTLWLAYSYPHMKVIGENNVPSVEIHLAKSSDNGMNWQFVKKLFEPIAINNPANPNQSGFLDHETLNLLPINKDNENFWLAARLNYFIPTVGGFSERPSNSFYITILKANTPENLTTSTEKQLIGGSLTHSSWNVHQILIPPDLNSSYFFWNEPALYYDTNNSKLYLIMVAFVYDGKTPVIEKHNTYVYATNPTGNPETWTWEYKGILVNQAIANELGAQKVSQTDLAKGKDGKLLLIASPVDWVVAENDYNNKGCKVIEVKSLEVPELERDSKGKLRIRTSITASDANNLGSGASAYDPNSETGILFTKRQKTTAQLIAKIHKTGAKP
ncbi:MAG: hypothetical protein OHK0038_14260 [Flammeovirgaceae bacterium]